MTGGDGFTSDQRHLGAVPGKTDIAKIVHERLRALACDPGQTPRRLNPCHRYNVLSAPNPSFRARTAFYLCTLLPLSNFKVNEARDHTLYASHTV